MFLSNLKPKFLAEYQGGEDLGVVYPKVVL